MTSEEFHRRVPFRDPQHGGGPRRAAFFKTKAGPGATAYPAEGDDPTVYYAIKLTGVTFPKTVGNQSLTSTEVSGSEEYIFNLDTSNYIEEGSIVLAWKHGNRWFTIDKVDVELVGITQRKLFDDGPDDLALDFATDFGSEITPSGSVTITGVAQESANPGFGTDNHIWIATTRNASTGKSAKLFTSSGLAVGTEIDFGADCLGVAARTNAMYLFGEADGSGNTAKRYDATVTAKTLLASGTPLETRVNAIAGLIGGSFDILCAGKGSKTVARVLLDFTTTTWTADPTGGSGEATGIGSVANGVVVPVCFKSVSGTNLYSLGSTGTTLSSATALGGTDLHALAQGTSPSSNLVHIIVGGVGDGSNTVACYTVHDSTGVWSLSWQYDTGSTVRDITMFDFGTFAGDGRVLVVGDRNGSNKTAWLLDEAAGTLIDDYDHGDDLRACAIFDEWPAAQSNAIVAGESGGSV